MTELRPIVLATEALPVAYPLKSGFFLISITDALALIVRLPSWDDVAYRPSSLVVIKVPSSILSWLLLASRIFSLLA